MDERFCLRLLDVTSGSRRARDIEDCNCQGGLGDVYLNSESTRSLAHMLVYLAITTEMFASSICCAWRVISVSFAFVL